MCRIDRPESNASPPSRCVTSDSSTGSSLSAVSEGSVRSGYPQPKFERSSSATANRRRISDSSASHTNVPPLEKECTMRSASGAASKSGCACRRTVYAGGGTGQVRPPQGDLLDGTAYPVARSDCFLESIASAVPPVMQTVACPSAWYSAAYLSRWRCRHPTQPRRRTTQGGLGSDGSRR